MNPIIICIVVWILGGIAGFAFGWYAGRNALNDEAVENYKDKEFDE